MEVTDPWIVYFFAVTAIAGFATLLIVIHFILRYKDPVNTILFLQHLSLLGEYISYLPYIYVRYTGACIAMGAFHFYFSLMNVLCMFFLSVYELRKPLFPKYEIHIEGFISHWWYCIVVFLFPCISFIPVFFGAYGEIHGLWCSILYEENTWALGIYDCWMMIILGITFILLIPGLYKSWGRKDDFPMTFLKLTSYVVATMIAWIPRIVPRFNNHQKWNNVEVIRLNSILPLFGLLFFSPMYFLYERKVLKKREASLAHELGTTNFVELRPVSEASLPSSSILDVATICQLVQLDCELGEQSRNSNQSHNLREKLIPK